MRNLLISALALGCFGLAACGREAAPAEQGPGSASAETPKAQPASFKVAGMT